MTLVSLCFEVHQPMRLKRSFFWDGLNMRRKAGSLEEFYFDDDENRRLFDRISSKCYIPANRTLLDGILKLRDGERPLKAAYSFSGIFLEGCRRYRPDVIDSFSDLVDTGMVEVMEQTYYHSLTSLYDDPSEFKDQVKMHREAVWDAFGLRPTTFENTELLYDDDIAGLVAGMGYRAIFTEGIVADPNYVYAPVGADIALLLRNYKLTDDVGFRFSSREWKEYPLTADKYATWLAAAPGDCINIFCDYETFGEHQWADTGIFDFLKALPDEVLKHDRLAFATPSETANIPPRGSLSVPKTVSWADIDRDTSCWLGNALQFACYTYEKRLLQPVRESRDPELMKIWRMLSQSDHLYYIYTRGGGPGEVHSYFSPYGNAYDAAVTLFSVLSDFHHRILEEVRMADGPFRFSKGLDSFTGDEVYTLEGLRDVLDSVPLDSLEYHMERGDIAFWIGEGLGNEDLAGEVATLVCVRGIDLRKGLGEILDGALGR